MRLHRLVVALLAAAALTGCSSDDGEADPAPSSASSSASASSAVEMEYVALGDSYAAAPGVPETTTGCFRSSGNYAHLVAASDDAIGLTDVTCSGATSSDVVEKQVPALSESTDLVTIGIGGNDFDLFTEVLSACLGSPCTEATAPLVERLLPDIETNIGDTLDAVIGDAPRAQVIVVGYPDLVPERGSCPDRIPLADEDLPLVDSVNQGLSDALRAQAKERGLDYVDVARASQGHDVCAKVPWVNGAETAPDGTIPFHPFAVEQEAVAELVLGLL